MDGGDKAMNGQLILARVMVTRLGHWDVVPGIAVDKSVGVK
jgi:hypothetical protein